MRTFAFAGIAIGLAFLTGCKADADEEESGDSAKWDFRAPDAGAEPLSAESQRHGGYPVGSQVKDRNAPGGFGRCSNFPKPLADQPWGSPDAISLVVFRNESVAFGKWKGFALRLVNRTKEAESFDACDSRLNLIQEAKDTDGEWKPIESPPAAICGNSFHRVYLKPNQYWDIAVPEYSGALKTRLRFRLDRTLKSVPLYSEEFEGSVHQGQFQPKR